MNRFTNFFKSKTKLSLKEQMLFAKRMSFLIKSGIPLTQSLTIIYSQQNNLKKQLALKQVLLDIEKGNFLHTALEKQNDFFSQLSINIIRIGESSGKLFENLEYLSEDLRKKVLLKNKLKNALFYPIFILSATFVIILILVLYILPKIIPIFKSLNAEVLVSTKILIYLSNFITNYWWLFIILIIAVKTFFKKILSVYPKIEILYFEFLLSVPFFSNLTKKYILANFCRTMGLLLNSNHGLEKSLSICGELTKNPIYKNEILNLKNVTLKGESLFSYTSKNKKFFPEIITQLIQAGENSGNLNNSFLYLSEMLEQEIDELTKNLSVLVEPMLMLIIGSIVGLIAISIITPIYSVTQKLNL